MDDSERIARAFHEAYERQAPHHGWETQVRSRKPWDEVPAENRALMISVAHELLKSGKIMRGPAL